MKRWQELAAMTAEERQRQNGIVPDELIDGSGRGVPEREVDLVWRRRFRDADRRAGKIEEAKRWREVLYQEMQDHLVKEADDRIAALEAGVT